MLAKFAIDYTALPNHSVRVLTHHTDDPVEAEEFLMHLLFSGARIKDIRHEGASLTQQQSDRMLKVASERIAALMLRDALGVDAAEVKHRFGFAA